MAGRSFSLDFLASLAPLKDVGNLPLKFPRGGTSRGSLMMSPLFMGKTTLFQLSSLARGISRRF